MIRIDGEQIDTLPYTGDLHPNSLQMSMIIAMQQSTETYSYDRTDQLAMELRLRDSIVSAARDFARSGVSFRVFRKSMANTDYWLRSGEGGFQLRRGIPPSDAILDIYRNGSLYGTECSTVMTIIYYRALLDVFPEDLYNRLYSGIYLYNWEHLDRDLNIERFDGSTDELPGDARYFINPDVEPLTPQWQGENVFYLGNRRYFGHGIGVTDARSIINGLNSLRREGATQSAYLIDLVKRQDYHHLANTLRRYEADEF